MSSFPSSLPALTALLLLSSSLLPMVALAEEGDPGRPRPDRNKPTTSVEAKVQSRPDGVYIQISVRQTIPGTSPSASTNSPAAPSQVSEPAVAGSSSVTRPASAGTQGGSDAAAASGRTWSDATGIHHESPDGQRIDLRTPMISAATRDGWVREFQQHPNEDPFILEVDGQFGGIIWLPRGTNPGNVNFGAPPATAAPAGQPAPQPAAPSAPAIDPREVAEDILDHVPLPPIVIRTNPGLGLVALPSWFWVEGYDGRPFGASRSVRVPPEVGDSISFDVVPEGDPRRGPGSFSVEVRVSPTSYRWSFGDGAGLTTRSLGRPYPAESDIQHIYQHSSLGSPAGFPVQLTVEFAAEYRVNGGAARPLRAIRRTYSASYRIQEVQPVLTQGQSGGRESNDGRGSRER